MKRSFLLILTLALIQMRALACGSTPTITGDETIKNKATFNYTLQMDQAYKGGSCGGYVSTSWSLSTVGAVGAGEFFTLDATNFNLAPGSYTLTATNSFVNGCTGYSYTYPIKVRKPDMTVLNSPALDANPGYVFLENNQYTCSVQVRNNGQVFSNPTKVKVFWSKDSSFDTGDFLAATIDVPVLGAFEQVTYSFLLNVPTLNSQGIGSTQNTWPFYCLFKIDPDNGEDETDESNNTRNNYLFTIQRCPGCRTTTTDLTKNEALEQEVKSDWQKDGELVQVSDWYGRVFWKKGDGDFDYSNLGDGLYVFKTKSGKRSRTHKVLIQAN